MYHGRLALKWGIILKPYELHLKVYARTDMTEALTSPRPRPHYCAAMRFGLRGPSVFLMHLPRRPAHRNKARKDLYF